MSNRFVAFKLRLVSTVNFRNFIVIILLFDFWYVLNLQNETSALNKLLPIRRSNLINLTPDLKAGEQY